MSIQLIFDPAAVGSLKCPFTFLIKLQSGKNTTFQHEPYSVKNLQAIYSEDYDQNTLKILSLLTAVELNKEKKKYASHYQQLRPKKELEDYIEQYLSEYYFKSFRQVFHIFSANQQLYHKIKVGQKRFKNLPCNFDIAQVPELSFKIERNGKKLSIATFFQLNNKIYEATEVNRRLRAKAVEQTRQRKEQHKGVEPWDSGQWKQPGANGQVAAEHQSKEREGNQ